MRNSRSQSLSFQLPLPDTCYTLRVKDIIGATTVVLGLFAYIPYLRDLFRRKIQPHPYSWFVWGLTASIMFALQITNGGGAMSWSTLMVGLISFFICAVSWRSGGKRIITRNDRVSFGAALIATVLWVFAREPTLSMLLLVCADLFGFIPSVRKTWRDPYSETLTMWSINVLRHGLNIFAITTYSLLTLVDPIVWAIGNLGFCLMVLVRRRVLRKA